MGSDRESDEMESDRESDGIQSEYDSEYDSDDSVLSEDHFDGKKHPTVREWALKEQIGKGSFGVVWRACHEDQTVALKIARRDEDSVREVMVLKHLGAHPHIVELLDEFEHVTLQKWIHKVSVFKLYDGDLFDYIELFEHDQMGFSNAKTILVQILRAMKHMKDKGVVHSDLKPENILVGDMDTHRPHVVVADFGSASINNGNNCLYGKTSHYRSPEIIVNAKNCMTPAADVWSFACISFELLTGESLFDPKAGFSSMTTSDERSDSRCSSSSEYDDGYSINFEHLSLMQEILGKFPRAFAKKARKYFNAKGQLLNNPDIYNLPLTSVLIEHGATEDEATRIDAFLKPMLMYSIGRRATVEEIMKHSFLIIEDLRPKQT